MTRTIRAATAALLGVGALACASGGGGGSMDSTFRSDMGRLLGGPLAEVQLKIWTKHSIPLFRKEESYRSVLYESEWIPRDVTPAEAAEGVIGARNRVFLRGRRVQSEMDVTTGLFRVTFEVQNQVRTEELAEWHPAPVSSAALERFQRVLGDMELELRSGIRRD